MKSRTLLLFACLFCCTIQTCQNNGVVFQNSTSSQELCICNQNFVGQTCNITAYLLTQQFSLVPIRKNYTFAYFVPTENVFFRLGLTFRSQNKNEVIDFLLFAQEQEFDNKIDIDPTNSNDLYEMIVGGDHGEKQISWSILISYGKKDNGEQPKIIFGFKQFGKNVSVEEQFVMIKCEVTQFVTIGFLIRSMSSVLIIITILMLVSLAISLRKKFLQRYATLRQKQNKQKHIHKIMPSQKYQSFVEENETVSDEENTNTCAICLCQFKMQQNIRKTPCGHIYHENCLDSWCNSHLNCPICRKNFEVEEEKHNIEAVNRQLRETNPNIRENMLS